MSLLVSVVVPFHNEVENVGPLVAEIRSALDGRFDYELLCVDDGSDDGTADRLAELVSRDPGLRVIRHARRAGQSAAVVTGVRAARGTWIATLDGDGQNDPADIPCLLAAVLDPVASPTLRLAIGRRRRRRDSLTKRVSSRVAAGLRARLLRDATPDTGCGLKVFHRESFLVIPHFDHMHRFLPALFLRNGWDVRSVEVNHRPRRHGRSHYGVLDRLWTGIADLAGVFWLQRRPIEAEVLTAMRARRAGAAAPAAGPGWSWLVVWGLAVAVALAIRPLLPIDETRYLSVAWEMWRRHDWVVPYLNGVPYSDKPPLFFWSMLAGWRVFGVNAWWPRLLSPIFGLVSALLLVRLARRLSPGEADANGEHGTGTGAIDLVLPFLGGALWVIYSTVVLFDTLLTACVLVALNGVVEAWRGRVSLGWLLFGLGTGLGALAKGPVVLVHVLPAALLAPWWVGASRPFRWRVWYAGVLGGLVIGVAIGLSWALVAADRGGAEYRAAILWGQTAGRVAHAFAHQRPWWWYLPMVPVILFPWAAWPPLWYALAAVRSKSGDSKSGDVTVRFAFAWVVSGVILLSLVSGKQVHYLIPLLPGFALLVARACARAQEPARAHAREILLPAGLLALGGVLLLASPLLVDLVHVSGTTVPVAPAWGLTLLAGAGLLGAQRGRRRQILALSWVSPALLVAAHLAGAGATMQRYDLTPMASLLRRAEADRQPVAYVGRYAGQFHFLGRLERRFDEVTPAQLPHWRHEHPNGLVIRSMRSPPGAVAAAGAVALEPYRGGTIGIWTAVGAERMVHALR